MLTNPSPQNPPDANREIVAPRPRKLPIFAAVAQGFFCLVIGLWPVVSYQSFEILTGQKPDRWLLSLAGLLLAGIGSSMLISAARRDVAFEVFALGLVTALSLAVTDVVFVIERMIPAVYLLDAVAESLFVTLWIFAIRDLRRARRLPKDRVSLIIKKSAEPGGMDGPG